jgi:hypothetical protein
LYESGRGGLAKNDQEAARLSKLAADQGYAAAQYNLGRFYEGGSGGLAKNDQEAARLYKLAADQGYAVADHPMRIVVVRSSQPGCEPKCAEWISAEGDIVLATAEQLRKIVNSLGGQKLPILIHSRGGLAYQATLMGFLTLVVGGCVRRAETNSSGLVDVAVAGGTQFSMFRLLFAERRRNRCLEARPPAVLVKVSREFRRAS